MQDIMSNSPLIDKLTSTPEGALLFHKEQTILEITSLICEKMEEMGVTRQELANRINGLITAEDISSSAKMSLGIAFSWKAKPKHIDMFLEGQIGMSVEALAAIFFVLGLELCVKAKKMKKGVKS